MHEKMHVKLKINEKERVWWTYWPWGRGKPCKKFGWKRKKIEDGACLNRREKKDFEKVIWISWIWLKKKVYSRFSIDRKSVSIDRNRQKLTKIFKCNFDWSKNRLDQSKFWKNRKFEKNNLVFWENSLKHWI